MHKGWRGRGYRVGPWYDRGADALATLGPACGWAYACPLCIRAFLPQGAHLLSVEHVPSKAMRGKPLVLTCKQCNQHAGRSMQKDQRRRQNISDVMSGRADRPHNVTLTVTDALGREPLLLGATIHRRGEYHLRPSRRTGKDRLKALADRLDTIKDTPDWKFGLGFPSDRFHPRAATVAYLRDAYLAAFAVWGYSYILAPQLEIVRRQIAAPRDALITRFHYVDPSANPDERWIAVVREPGDLRCILVAFGNDRVILPRPDTPIDIYAQAAASTSQATVRGRAVPWPRKAAYRLDVQPALPT